MYKNVIGKRSNKVKNIVERGMVKRFVDSIGDAHQIYLDESVGKQSRYGNNIAPPTYPRVFDYGDIPELSLPKKGLIHGEQIYEYKRPLIVGEELQCYAEVQDYYERTGGSGWMGFLVIERRGEDKSGELIFTEKMVLIITETVREAMKQ